MNDKEIENIFNNNDINSLAGNLNEMIISFKATNNLEHKKNLKSFLKFILNYLSVKVNVGKSVEFLNVMSKNILQMSTLFPEIMNSFIKLLLKDLEGDIFTQKFKENSEDGVKIQKLVNSSLLILTLTSNLNQPNQMLTNYISLINSFLDKLPIREDYHEEKGRENIIKNILLKVYFIGVLSILGKNTNSYIPNLFNQLEHVLNLMKVELVEMSTSNLDSVVVNCEEENNFKILQNINFYLNSEDVNFVDKEKNKTHPINVNSISNINIPIIYSKLLSIISFLINTFKDDLNFEILFKNIILNILEINQNFLTKNKTNNTPNKSNTPSLLLTKSHELIEAYEDFKSEILKKKNIEINFMKIKKKEIGCLEPDIDLCYLGRSYIRTDADNQRIAKAIKKKIKSTSKQAVRNLKKESKVIDVQRQKKLKIIVEKKKEDQRQSNQFIEQQNIEYKKLVTSQPKKRFKLKKARGRTRG